jgi:hypothetical protein
LAVHVSRFNAAITGFVAGAGHAIAINACKSLISVAFGLKRLSLPRGAFPALQAGIALLYAAASEACFAVPW